MKPLSRLDRVKMVLDEVHLAQKRACAVIHSAYPVGGEITWERGGHLQHGIVLSNSTHGSGDSFRVRNSRTGKEYWIDFYNVQLASRPQSVTAKEG
jgi:hypothetical protein